MPYELISTGEATAILPTTDSQTKPITVIGTDAIRNTFDEGCLRQAVNSRLAPGVTDFVLNPDAHVGYGAPVGCVMVSPTHIYPGPVGVDIKCSMSLLQLSVPADEIVDRKVRRALINAICERTPTGAGRGQQSAPKSRRVDETLGRQLMLEGASESVCSQLGIPLEWAERCEDAFHVGHDDTRDALEERLDRHLHDGYFRNKFSGRMKQLGSYGGGNHFGECEVVHVEDNERARKAADVFGMKDGHVAFLSHCGSRGIGHNLADGQFKALQAKFARWDIPLPGQDRELVYAPLRTAEADAYLDDMALGANFATANHMLINALVLEAFQEIIPGTTGELVYFYQPQYCSKGSCEQQHCLGSSQRINAGVSWGASCVERDALRKHRTPDPVTGKSAGRVECDGRRRRRERQLLQRQPRRWSSPRTQTRDPGTRPEIDRPVLRRPRHPEQLPPVSKRRSASGLQGFQRSPAVCEVRRPGNRSRKTESPLCDQRWRCSR